MTAEVERPLGRDGVLQVALALVVFVPLVVWLRSEGMVRTGYFGMETGVSAPVLGMQLAALALGSLALQALPSRFTTAIAVAESLACLSAYGVQAVGFVAALAVWYLSLEIPLAGRVRLVVPAVLLFAACALGWLVECQSPFVVGTPGAALGLGRIVSGPLLFSALFTPRLMMYAWEKWQRGWPPGDWRGFVQYFAVAPYLVFPPYVVFVPFLGASEERRFRTVTREHTRGAMRAFGLSLLSTVGLVVLDRLHLVREGFPHVSEYVCLVLRIGALGYLTFGFLLLHGIVDRPPIHRPLLAANPVDVWNRLQTHQKDMQLAMFYAPTLLWLRRRNRYLAIVAATAVTILGGNFAIHVFARYLFTPRGLWHRTLVLYECYAILFVALAAELCLQEWRRRTKRKGPRGVVRAVYTFVCWAGTLVFTAIMMSY